MFELEAQQLKELKIKPSKQRLLILKFLNENYNSHKTADEIFDYFRKSENKLSLATIYNTINLFKEKNLIHTLKLAGSDNKYEINTDGHIHFECKKCNKIYNVKAILQPLEDEYKDFEVQEKNVFLVGICPNCK